MLLCWAVIAVAVFINTVVSGLLPIIEGLILIFHVLGFVAVLVPLVVLSPQGSTASVFQTSLNQGGWPTQGLSYCVGFIGNVATFVGEFMQIESMDSCYQLTSFHHQAQMPLFMSVFPSFFVLLACYSQMSEEIDNAALNVPRAIFITMILNGATGFGMVLATMYCLGDIDTVIVGISISGRESH